MMRKLPIIKEKIIKLNLGCGNDKEKGFIGIDVKDCGQEIIWDIRDGIPFPDNSVDLIWTSHMLEHLDNEETEELFREIYRVLKINGISQNVVPHVLDPTAYYFDHKTFWNEARIETLPGVPGLERFEIIKNLMTDKLNSKARLELLFELRKI
jgi:predicted SAM-dependent methyltransferase